MDPPALRVASCGSTVGINGSVLQEMPDIRGAEIGMVFQDPMTSLNPVQRIMDQFTETIHTHEPESAMLARRGPKSWWSAWVSDTNVYRNTRTSCPAACASVS